MKITFNRTIIILGVIIGLLLLLTVIQSYDPNTGKFENPFYRDNLNPINNDNPNTLTPQQRSINEINRELDFGNSYCYVKAEQRDGKIVIVIYKEKNITDKQCGANEYLLNKVNYDKRTSIKWAELEVVEDIIRFDIEQYTGNKEPYPEAL